MCHHHSAFKTIVVSSLRYRTNPTHLEEKELAFVIFCEWPTGICPLAIRDSADEADDMRNVAQQIFEHSRGQAQQVATVICIRTVGSTRRNWNEYDRWRNAKTSCLCGATRSNILHRGERGTRDGVRLRQNIADACQRRFGIYTNALRVAHIDYAQILVAGAHPSTNC